MIKHIDKSKIKEYEYFIKAFSSVALNKQPPEPDKNLDWNFIYQLSESNNGTTMLLKALENVQNKPSSEILDKITSKATIYTIQDANQMYELTSVMEDFEKNGVYFIPLKGYVIKSDYPKTEFRIMTDCDILFKEEQIDKVKSIYAKHGFLFDYFDNDNQYHFDKKPYIFVEMHTSLVNHRDEKYDYFCNIWKKSKPKNNYKFWYEMSHEDFYLFLVEHGANHYVQGGMGIRILLDMFLYKTKYKDSINQEQLSQQLKNTDLVVFEKKLWEICEKWFVKNDLENLSLLEEFILLSATIGRVSVAYANISLNHKRKMEQNNKKPSKVKFFLQQTFPSKSKMLSYYPYLNKLPFLLPVSWVQMWFKRFFILKNVNFKSGLKNRINYINAEEEQYINTLLKTVGFKEK